MQDAALERRDLIEAALPSDARRARRPGGAWTVGLARDDVDGLGALVPGLGVIRDARALGQRLVAVAADAAVMNEEVLARLVGRDEPKPLVVAEPLHGSCSHVITSTAYVHCVRGGAARQQLRAPNTAVPNGTFGLKDSI